MLGVDVGSGNPHIVQTSEGLQHVHVGTHSREVEIFDIAKKDHVCVEIGVRHVVPIPVNQSV